MKWTEHVVWWHVYPLGFVGSDTTGADRSPTLRLLDLIPWLDHLLDLGANGLILGPVFASSSHGYDTIDWFTVDPRLGSEVELVTLMDAAHARGIKIMLDGVFNHVGPEYAPLISVRDNLAAENTDLFRLEADGSFATFEGHGGLIALNHASPEVARTVSDVLSYWAERGADAWRLDAAYAVPSTFGQLYSLRSASAIPICTSSVRCCTATTLQRFMTVVSTPLLNTNYGKAFGIRSRK